MMKTTKKLMSNLGKMALLVITAMLVNCGQKVLDDSFAFVHVNVIPMDQERVLPDQTVIVRNGRISEIGPASSTDVPGGAFRINKAGHYLIPALSDMHVHLEGQAWNMMFPPEGQFTADDLDFSHLLFPYVANGVATVQVMSALPEHIALREQINRGEILGPRLILSRMIDGPEKAWPPPISTWVKTPDEARQVVLDSKEAGYDRIKVYSFLNQECYDSVLSAAKEVDIGVGGHIPVDLSVEYILEAGQGFIAHAEEVMKHTHGKYDEEQIEYFARIIAEKGTWMTPTLLTSRNILAIFDDFDKELGRPEVRYLHPMALGIWSFVNTNLYQKISQESRAKIREGFELFQRPFTKAFHDVGGNIMTGTDALIPSTVPGFSIHEELEELVDVGLTPYKALRTSTMRPHEFLGELDEAGTIEVGKRADLVLLENNPLEEIRNTRKITGVMIRGRWLSQTEIQKGLDAVLAFYESLNK